MQPIMRIKDSTNKKGQFFLHDMETELDYSSKELTGLYRMWLNTPKKAEWLAVPDNIPIEVTSSLKNKGVLKAQGKKIRLTFEGKKLLNKIILTTEKSSFEKKGIDVVDAINVLATKKTRSTNLSLTKKAFNLKQHKNGNLSS